MLHTLRAPGRLLVPDDLEMVTNLRQDSQEMCERPSGKTLAPREKTGKLFQIH